MALRHVFKWAQAAGAFITGAHWDAPHEVDADGLPMAAGTTTPAAPAPGNLVLFGRTKAGGALPAFIGPSGLDSSLQPFLGGNNVAIWAPLGNTNSGPVTAFGISVPGYQGSATARNVATTNMLTSMKRIGAVSAATAGSIARVSPGSAQYWRGNAPGLGGFRAVFRFGCSDAAPVAGARTFVGFGSSSFGSAEPSAMLNMVGIGTDSGDVNFSIMHNDGAGTATKIPLGANFPDHTLSADVYELTLFCAPNSTEMGWEVRRLNTGDAAIGTITTDLPANTALIFPQFGRNNGATALAVGIDMVRLYVETDN